VAKYQPELNLGIIPELATGGKYIHIPYGQLEANPSTFINPVYCPPRVTLKDPQNMPMEDIKTFLCYIQDRKMKFGQTEAFRFRKYKDKIGLHDAAYAASAAVPLGDGSQSFQPIEHIAQADTQGMTVLGTEVDQSHHGTHHGISAYRERQERQTSHRSDEEGIIDVAKSRDPLRLVSCTWLQVAHREPTVAQGDPAEAQGDPAMAHSNILIDQSTMSMLTGFGVPTSILVNGPADEQPQYYMLQWESGFFSQENIDPLLLCISQSNTSSNH
jgi:hypothetical protein